jgi:polysaccharide biosynthesis transport protein
MQFKQKYISEYNGSIQSDEQVLEQFDFWELLHKLWRRKFLILITSVVLIGFSLILITKIQPMYSAVSVVMLNNRSEQVLNVEAVLSRLIADTETVASEIQLIRSRTLAQKVVEQLGLHLKTDFLPPGPQPSPIQSLIGELPAPLRGLLPNTWLPIPPEPLSKNPKPALVEWRLDQAVDLLLSKLDVTPEGRSRVIKISYSSKNPELAQQIVNTLATLYIQSQVDARSGATRRANRWLNERIAELGHQVEASEIAVEDFRKEAGLVGGNNTSVASQQVFEVSTQLTVARAERSEAEARLRQVDLLKLTRDGFAAIPEILKSDVINHLRQQETDMMRREAELANSYGDRHPALINLRTELRNVQNKLRTEIDKVVAALRNEVEVATAREQSLTASLDRLKGEIARLNEAEVQLRTLEREAEANRRLFEQMLARSKETGAQTDFQDADASIVSLSPVPYDSIYPNKPLIRMMSVVISLCVGVAVAFLVEMLDRGFRSMEQIGNMLGVMPLGLIPALRRSWWPSLWFRRRNVAADYILRKSKSAFAEAIRRLYIRVMLASEGSAPKVILVTSAVPSEGKTTVALSLARLLALANHRVLLIDADVRRPSIHKALGIDRGPGLVEFLKDEASAPDVVYNDEKSGMLFIPAGGAASDPPSLLGSKQMKSLLDVMRPRFDLIIIDSAPVLAVSDTLPLARIADSTILVIQWVKTDRKLAMAGLREVIDAGGIVAGALLTRVHIRRHRQYRYYDSGYYAGSMKRYYVEH